MISEDNLLREVLPSLRQGEDIVVGPGDDCAVVDIGLKDKLMLLAVDQVVGEVHYLKEVTTPEQIAAKLLKRNISDIAAMGGVPAHALLTIACKDNDIDWYKRFFKGIAEEAEKWNISVCGGDLASTKYGDEVCSLSITGFVTPEKLCLRKNAKPGEIVCVTGELGNTFNSGHHLNFVPRLEIAQYLAGEYTNCIMDISDGLIPDVARISNASKISTKLFTEKIPLRKGADLKSGLTEGEDYELLMSISPENYERLKSEWPFKDVILSDVGVFTNLKFDLVYDSCGDSLITNYGNGFDHLNRSR